MRGFGRVRFPTSEGTVDRHALRLASVVAVLGVATYAFGWLAGGMFIAAVGISVALAGVVGVVCVAAAGALSHARR